MSVEKKLSRKAARIERKKSKTAPLQNLVVDQLKKLPKEEEKEEPNVKKLCLSDDESLSILKTQLNQRSAQLSPMFRLVHVGLSASLSLPKASRVPILASDVQAFLISSIVGETAFYQPYKWYTLARWTQISQVLVMVIENVSVDDLEGNQDIFTSTMKIFQDKVEMNCTKNEGYSLDLALAYVPISAGMKKQILKGYPSLKAAAQDKYIYGLDDSDEHEKDTAKDAIAIETIETDSSLIRESTDDFQKNELANKESTLNSETTSYSSDPTQNQPKEKDSKFKIETIVNGENTVALQSLDSNDNPTENVKKGCTRLELLLNASLLVEENYPLPGCEEYSTFKLSQETYQPVTENSPMFSIDCEWCICIDGSYGLARVAVVNENFDTCYHTFVKPELEIVDYLTRFSGITEETLRDVKKTLTDVQNDLQQLFTPDTILIGQSLQSDLKALKLMHPYIIDTSVIFNLTGVRSFKSKLKVLSAAFCDRRIQDSTNGHDPTEDAMAAMELVTLKLKMGIEFGDLAILRKRERDSKSKRTKDPACDQECSIHMKLFTFIQSYNLGATLITSNSTVENSYRPGLSNLKESLIRKKKKKDHLAEPVEVLSAKDFQDAVRLTQESRLNNSFTLVHTSLGNNEPTTKENLEQLDNVIQEIYEGISLNGMMVVILAGTNDFKNGACLVRVKKK